MENLYDLIVESGPRMEKVKAALKAQKALENNPPPARAHETDETAARREKQRLGSTPSFPNVRRETKARRRRRRGR